MALSYIGTLPDRMTVADVVTYSVTADSMPATIIARRATLDELVYDADRGFTDAWKGFSSISETVDGFELVLGRRAFSAAGSQIFWADGASSGGGGEGGAPTDAVYLVFDGNPPPELPNARALVNGDGISFEDQGPGGSLIISAPPGGAVGSDDVSNDSAVTGTTVSDALETLAETAARGAWLTGLDLDLTAQANQTITTGTPTIAGKTWTAVDISTYSSQFEIVNGTGLQMKGNAANSGMYDTFRTLAHLKIKLVDFCPGIHLKSRIRMTCVLSTSGAAAASEVVMVALGSWTHSNTAASIIRCVPGYISGPSQRRIDGWRTSGAPAYDDTTIPLANAQMQIQIDNIEDWAGSFLSSPYTIASPVVWKDPKTFVHARRYDFQARLNAITPPSSSGFIADGTTRPANTVLTDINEMALLLGFGTGNTANNTSFIARIQAVRVEYTK